MPVVKVAIGIFDVILLEVLIRKTRLDNFT